MLRLLLFLGARDSARVAAITPAHHKRLSASVAQLRKAEEVGVDSAAREKELDALMMQESMLVLERLLGEASKTTGSAPPESISAAHHQVSALEAAMHTEMRYVHGPDWEVKPGKLISKKGTWLKRTTRFSWEIAPGDKLYLPEGVALPVLQIGRVTDTSELKLHEWSAQHLRVWLKPPIVRTMETRKDVWFVYWPHFEGEETGTVIVATADTWLKRSTQMSGELQPFELVYVPKGMLIHLSKVPAPVDEEWEKNRHAHVHQHKKVTLAAQPLTMRRDKYDIFVGQPEDKIRAKQMA